MGLRLLKILIESDVNSVPAEKIRITTATLFVSMAPLGDAIIGDQLRKMLGRERDTVRRIIGSLLSQVLEPHRS